MTTDELYARFVSRAGLASSHSVRELAEAIRRIPHGRPRARTAEAVVEDWRGTCSTKHLLLRALRPDLDVRFVNRVFTLTPERARALLGDEVARVVPPEGMPDVHTYATIALDGRRVRVDLTFAGEPWDGWSDMPIPWGDGVDHEGGSDPIASKDRLVAELGAEDAKQRLVEALSRRA